MSRSRSCCCVCRRAEVGGWGKDQSGSEGGEGQGEQEGRETRTKTDRTSLMLCSVKMRSGSGGRCFAVGGGRARRRGQAQVSVWAGRARLSGGEKSRKERRTEAVSGSGASKNQPGQQLFRGLDGGRRGGESGCALEVGAALARRRAVVKLVVRVGVFLRELVKQQAPAVRSRTGGRLVSSGPWYASRGTGLLWRDGRRRAGEARTR